MSGVRIRIWGWYTESGAKWSMFNRRMPIQSTPWSGTDDAFKTVQYSEPPVRSQKSRIACSTRYQKRCGQGKTQGQILRISALPSKPLLFSSSLAPTPQVCSPKTNCPPSAASSDTRHSGHTNDLPLLTAPFNIYLPFPARDVPINAFEQDLKNISDATRTAKSSSRTTIQAMPSSLQRELQSAPMPRMKVNDLQPISMIPSSLDGSTIDMPCNVASILFISYLSNHNTSRTERQSWLWYRAFIECLQPFWYLGRLKIVLQTMFFQSWLILPRERQCYLNRFGSPHW